MSFAKLDEQLCFAIYSASNHITNLYRPILETLDLTYTQFVVMMALWKEDNISITKISRTVGLSKATMTPLLKRLEEKKLITRLTLPDNERQKSISLTKTGRELSLQSEAITNQVFCATGLSKKQASDMITLCQKLMT